MSAARAAGLVVCLLLAAYTANKLRKMAMIRGWLPGARVAAKVVTGKETTLGRHGPAYWIAWDYGGPAVVGNHRMNLEQDAWAAITVGDAIDLVYVGNDPSPYLRDGIFASAGNFGFDLVLLTGELLGAAACVLVGRRRRPGRGARPRSPRWDDERTPAP